MTQAFHLTPGLIGNWSPGIGDPTLAGWLTVLLYFAAAGSAWRLLRNWKGRGTATMAQHHERWFWRALLLALLLLGVNKQLDLQTAFTEMGRMLSDRQGWYENRRQVQAAFIAGVAIMGLTVLAMALHLTWHAPGATRWALAGGVCLSVFVVIRATSLHHVDAALAVQWAGLQVNWLLEIGGLLVIIAGAWRRRRTP